MNLEIFLTWEAGFSVIGTWLIVYAAKTWVESNFPKVKLNKIFNKSILPLLTVLVSTLLTFFVHSAQLGDESSVFMGIVLGCFVTLFHGSIKSLLKKSNLIELRDSIKPPKGDA
jgi:xanthine/uracil permease